VNELETRLRDLGHELALPWEPDLLPGVMARLERPARRRWRRPLVAAVALGLLALAIAFAVPPARSAILRFFHLGAVSVERVDTLPPARERPLTAGFGLPTTRAKAERRAGFKLLVPPFSGSGPERVYAAGPGVLGTVLDVPVPGGRRAVLLVEIEGSDLGFAKKVVKKETRIAPTSVDGSDALWIRGPHVVTFVATPNGTNAEISRVSGNALVWQLGNVTLRLEGRLTEEEALRLARTIRPAGVR
jgi:hypothetical protein